MWYQEESVSVDLNGNYEFSVKTLIGRNAVSGVYSVQIKWHNFDVNMTQIGYSCLNFQVIHNTNLTAINSFFELYAGDPLLLRIKFIDSDFNESIPFGDIYYNSTYGESGSMTYQGSGIYLADLDTNALELGDYYFSFNATKEYYENNYKEDIIHLRIIAQPLKLEVSHEILTAMANRYITCDINITGAFTGALIYPVNISTDWLNPYSVVDHGDGSFTLNFSTYNLPTQGISEIYTILISSDKKNYGATSHPLTLTIDPIQTIISVDLSVVHISIDDGEEVELSFSEEESGALINGAICSVTWPGDYSIISQPQGFILLLNTSNLSIDTYTAILKLEKVGYETAYKSIIVVVEQRKIEVSTIGFQDSIQAVKGQRIGIKLNLTDQGSSIFIENATLYYSWDFGTGFFDYVGNGNYELNLKLPNVEGSHKINLTISTEDNLYKTQEFSFIIVISEIQLPNYLVYILIIGVVILVSVLGIIGVRSHIFLPRKREKEARLLAKTQRFKDAMNVNGVVMSTSVGGITIYTKSYYEFEIYKKDLLSGFIYAITTISKEFMTYEEAKKVKQEEKDLEAIESIFELDFKYFNFLICDYKDLRAVFILKESPSENLKDEAMVFLKAISSQVSNRISDWDGSLEEYEKIITPSLNDYIFLHYKEYFILNKPKHINKVISIAELTTMESRIINVIKSMTSTNPKFYLEDVLTTIDEKNKDLVIIGLESIIKKRIVIPSPKVGEELLSIL